MLDLTSTPSLASSIVLRLDDADGPGASGGDAMRPLLRTPRMNVRCLEPRASLCLPSAPEACDRILLVIRGVVGLTAPDTDLALATGALLHVAVGADLDVSLRPLTPGARLLDLEVPGGDPATSMGAAAPLVVAPDDPPPYRPARHRRTLNRRLFMNAAVEVVHGCIEAGGGSELHTHAGLEQLTCVLDPQPQVLVYTPPDIEHGGGTEHALDLLVIYSPPYAERVPDGGQH